MAASWTLHPGFFLNEARFRPIRAPFSIFSLIISATPSCRSRRWRACGLIIRARGWMSCARGGIEPSLKTPLMCNVSWNSTRRVFRRDGRPPDSAFKTWRAFKALRGEYALTMCVRGSWTALKLADGCWFDRGADRLEMKRRRQRPPDHAADAALQMLAARGIKTESRPPRFLFYAGAGRLGGAPIKTRVNKNRRGGAGTDRAPCRLACAGEAVADRQICVPGGAAV